MAADDLEPTRMAAAKAAARAFVENQPRTIMSGVVAFSNGGLVVEPPTNDQAAILAAIERLSPQGGTSLGQGIFAALNAIAGEALAIDEAALEEGTAIGICLVAWQTSGMQPDAGPAPAA
jgi:Ca-activated chloride channel family protein